MNKKKEVIFLKRRYPGPEHKLIKYNENEYVFSPAESWMPIYITGAHDNIKAIDSDGGPMIYVGDETIINGKKVKRIYYEEGIGYVVEFDNI